ncbi:MAG TPA: P-loop NTPase [Gemmatimonas sp.]|nr:P-loop NTPase [Gemmatimonas sp.]
MKPVVPATGKRLAIVVTGAAGPEDLLNQVLEPRGFAPVMMVGSLAELTTQLRSRGPALVVVPVQHAGSGSDFPLFAAELRRHANTAAIGTSPTKDADTVLAAMRAGVLEFVQNPIDLAEFTTAVSHVLSNVELPAQSGRVFTVYSAKGGVGTSTTAASLAWALSRISGKHATALVDFTSTGAGVRVMLNLSPMYDLGTVATRVDRLDRDYLKSLMTQHPEGVSVLPAAEELDAADTLDARAAGRLIELLRQDYTYSVIDVDHHFSDPTLAALDSADRILLVTQLDISALRSSQRSLGLFARLGYPPEKVVVVVNRRSDRDRIQVADAERVLGRSIEFRLDNDYAACSDAIVNGQFLQKQAAGSPLAAAVSLMASRLTGTGNGHQSAAGERSRLSRLFSRKPSK